MEEEGGGGGLVVIDGSQLRSLDPVHLPSTDETVVTGARIVEIAESAAAAAAALFGLSFPSTLRSSSLDKIDGGDSVTFRSREFTKEEASKKARDYLSAAADQLRDEPLVVSILDGSALRLFLGDEDDFAMLAENLFTDLDVQDTGKLGKGKIRSALAHMGPDMGVPPFSESNDLLTSILKKHGAEGDEELGQAQFAQLLQPVLQELADSLAKNHVTVIQNITILNGSKLREVLNDAAVFNDVIEKMYQDWDAYDVGEENCGKLRGFLQAKGLHLGLPPPDSSEAIPFLYDQIFLSVNEEKIIGELTRDTFQEVVKYVLEKFAEQLEATPVFVCLES